MSTERRSAGAPTQVTTKLFATIAVFIGLVCIFGGYLFGRMARPEIKRNNDVISLNLTVAADNLYKKARRLSPKAVHHNNPEKIQSKMSSIFQCSNSECGTFNKYNLSEYVKNSINYEVIKLIKVIQNATQFIDSLS